MEIKARPLPVPDADSVEFWEGCNAHELRLQECRNCGEVRHYPRSHCPNCRSAEARWIKATGRGRIHSFVVIYRALHPAFQEKVPYVVALIELEEGPRMISDLIDCDPAQVTIGMPVTIVFEDTKSQVSIPHFRRGGNS